MKRICYTFENKIIIIYYKYKAILVCGMDVKLGSRKIQNIGDSFFVSMPRPWIRTHKLGQGDQVNIDMLGDGSLKISPVQGGT